MHSKQSKNLGMDQQKHHNLNGRYFGEAAEMAKRPT